MEPLIHRISAWDGLALHVREWPGDPVLPPILCLPGLVRTGGDFARLIAALRPAQRVIAPDYVGRGDSDYARDLGRYSPEACARDVMDLCAALHVHGALVIGTSFGGLLAMGLAVFSPGLVRAVVLNDIGPEVAPAGRGFVRDFVALDPAAETEAACIALLRERLPPLSLETEEDWQRMAALTYRRGADQRFHPLWDIRIAQTLEAPVRDLWPLWGAIGHLPVLLIWGQASTLLLADTVTRMQRERPDMTVVPLPGIGHAPILTEPRALDAIGRFVHAWTEARANH